MSNYYLILIWTGIYAFLSMYFVPQKIEEVCGEKAFRYKWIWAFAAFLPLLLWAPNRGWIGDTYMYTKTYTAIPAGLSNIPVYMETVTKDKGFYFFSAVIKALIGENSNTYLLIIALVQVLLLIKVYRKYSFNYAVSFFLFIASTDYISWMFNGIRQFTAVVITFAAFEYILEKKYVKAIVIIWIASLFHGTALLVIPFVFIAQGRAWNRKTVFFIFAVLAVVICINQFTNILDTMLQETQYENVVSDWQEFQDDGTNILRVLVYSVPAIISFLGLKHIRAANNPVVNICTNMSIAAAGIYVVSMFTSGIFIGRLPIYFSLYSYILLPWEVENIFTERSARLIYAGMTGAYLGFYLFSMMSMGL